MSNGEVFRQKFTRIEGLSSIRRLPRLGKIRLGVKKISKKTGKEYPAETEYFVCPAEVRKIYGDEPKELRIMFPINDPEVIFPQCYKWYGTSMGLKCKGDGVNALRLNEQTMEMEERECPCEMLENNSCKQRASLIFILPNVAIGGVYQIDLSSYHSIVDINSSIDYARALLNDKISMIPFILKRVPTETHKDGQKQIHYTLQLTLDITAEEIIKLNCGEKLFIGQGKKYQIEEPKEENDINPAYDNEENGAVVVEEDEEESEEKEVVKEEKPLANKEERDKKLKENEDKIKKIEEIAKANGYKTWGEIIYAGIKYGSLFNPGIASSQAKRIILDHDNIYHDLIDILTKHLQV